MYPYRFGLSTNDWRTDYLQSVTPEGGACPLREFRARRRPAAISVQRSRFDPEFRRPGGARTPSHLTRRHAHPRRAVNRDAGGQAMNAATTDRQEVGLPAGRGCPARPVRGAGKPRQGAEGGRRAAHAEGTARHAESRAESIGCVDFRESRAGFSNARFTRDNFRCSGRLQGRPRRFLIEARPFPPFLSSPCRPRSRAGCFGRRLGVSQVSERLKMRKALRAYRDAPQSAMSAASPR